jgi:dihydroorotate dehydrogenase electron transfer subunit
VESLFIAKAPVDKVIELDNQIFLLKLYCPQISTIIKPGEFLNVRVSESNYPLLRRPFSVCDVEGDFFYLMFNILGEGTKILSEKRNGEIIDVIGPLGNGFNLDGEFGTAIIAAGGLGAAPFPYVIRRLNEKKNVKCFIGGKTNKDIIIHGMKNISIATEDGSLEFQGNVIQLLREKVDALRTEKIKIFGCGPTAMLRRLKEFAVENNFDCEVSTECPMACGFGICQGCPIENVNNPNKYFLVCKDGPVFNVKDVAI